MDEFAAELMARICGPSKLRFGLDSGNGKNTISAIEGGQETLESFLSFETGTPPPFRSNGDSVKLVLHRMGNCVCATSNETRGHVHFRRLYGENGRFQHVSIWSPSVKYTMDTVQCKLDILHLRFTSNPSDPRSLETG